MGRASRLRWVADDGMSGADAQRYLEMMAGGNARRAYGLG